MLVVLVRALTRCNLSCGFCAHDRRLPGPRPALDSTALTHLIRLLGAVRARTGRDVLLSWLGGEPLLWRERPQFDALAHALDLRLSLTSNGYALTQPGVRAQLLAQHAELTVSLDAAPAVHDRLRGRAGLFEHVVSGLQALLAARRTHGAGLKVRINSVLMRSTIDAYPELLARLLREVPGIDEFTCNLLGGRDRPEFHSQASVQPSQWESFVTELPALRALAASFGARLALSDRYVSRLRAQVEGLSWPVEDCAPGRDFLFVDEFARLAPCAFTAEDYGVNLGSLADCDDLLALENRFRAQRARQRLSICGHCPSTQHAGKFTTTTGAKGEPARGGLLVAEENAA